MEKQIGKLYVSRHTERRNDVDKDFKLVILCTGAGKGDRTFSGVVVEQTDEFSDHCLGNYSETWTWHPDIFKEHDESVTINNINWRPHIDIGACQG